MVMLTVGDILVDISFGLIPAIILIIMQEMKDARYAYILPFIIHPLYYIIYDIFYHQTFPKDNWIFTLLITMVALFELMSVYTSVKLCCKGDFWQNYFIQCVAHLVGSIAATVGMSICPPALEAYNQNVLCAKEVSVVGALLTIVITIITSIAVGFLMKLIRKVLPMGHKRVYLILSVVYLTIMTVSAIMRYAVMEKNQDNLVANLNIYFFVTVIICIAQIVLGLYFVIYIYNQLEKKRLEKVRVKLTEEVSAYTKQNVSLSMMNRELKVEELKTNEGAFEGDSSSISQKLEERQQTVYSQVYTGEILFDAMIQSVSESMKAEGIAFEYTVDQLANLKAPTVDELTGFVSSMLSIGMNESKKCAGDQKFVALSIRTKGNMCIVKMEFSKDDKSKLVKKKLDKEQKNTLFGKIIHVYQAVWDVKGRSGHGEIRVMFV